MAQISFDTLAYSKKLQKAGMPVEQAEALSDAQKDTLEKFIAASELATKTDLQAEVQDVRNEIQLVRSELKTEIQNVRSELKSEIQDVRIELKSDIADTKHEILKCVMGIALAQTAVIVAVIGVAIALIAR